MLYDAFICHASEDKHIVVRPLAEALQAENVAVWYDEFTLKLGDSIRRSLDKGLAQSRFGVVVLSHSFFEKNWPQYELDGLAEREMKGNDVVLLPVWHGVVHNDVYRYSPSLAGRKAVTTDGGIEAVVEAILAVLRPQQSPLIIARDTLLQWGISPPVVTDQYWLEVTEASNRLPGFGGGIPEESTWRRWSFPLPEKEDDAKSWGERLAWTAMQLNWVDSAERIPISPLTPPEVVLRFVQDHAGLFETCIAFPRLAAEYAPQLTIRGMGADLEPVFEEEYKKSVTKSAETREKYPRQGSALTTTSIGPRCDEEWALRHPTFGDYLPVHLADAYFHGGTFGPQVSPFRGLDHALWLLSEASDWLPTEIHGCLLEGVSRGFHWPWGGIRSGTDTEGDWNAYGALNKLIWKCVESRTKFAWDQESRADAIERVRLSAHVLALPEPPEALLESFIAHEFPQKYIALEREMQYRHGGKAARKQPKDNVL